MEENDKEIIKKNIFLGKEIEIFEEPIPVQEGIDFENHDIIKYRVIGSFLTKEGKVHDVKSDFFQDAENPINARNKAMNFFHNYIGLLTNDLNEKEETQMDFDSLFDEEKNGKVKMGYVGYITHSISVEYTFDGSWFDEIDFYGLPDKYHYSHCFWNLHKEMEYYKKHNFHYEETKVISYFDYEEWAEGPEAENYYETCEILGTSIVYKDKEEEYWWESEDEKKKIEKQNSIYNLIERALQKGEDHFVEFKPSLLHNFKTNEPGISVKYVIAKAICSFLNSDGGLVVIGVNDEARKIQGLDHDFQWSDKSNARDYFRLQFDDLLRQFFNPHTSNYVSCVFSDYWEKEVFIICVYPSDEPVYLLNNYEKRKEFFIRTTASSEQITDIEYVVKYCMNKWGRDEELENRRRNRSN